MAAEVKRLEVAGIRSIFYTPWLDSDEDAKTEEKWRAAIIIAKEAKEKWRAAIIRCKEKWRAATIRAEVIRRKNEINQIAREDAKKSLLGAVARVMLDQTLSNDKRWKMIQAEFITYQNKVIRYQDKDYLQANERIEAKPAGIGPYSLISNAEGKRGNPVFILCNSVIDNSPLHALLAGDFQGGGRNRNPRQITGRNADHTAIHIRVAVPTGGPDAGGGGGPDADGGGGPDAGGGGGPDAGGGGGPPGGGPDAGGGGGPDAGGGGGPDAGGGGNLAVCVFTASVGKAALLRYTATPGSSRSRSRSTKSAVLSYLIMTFDTVAFLTSLAAIYMRHKRPRVSTILENVAAFSLISGFICMNMKDEFLA